MDSMIKNSKKYLLTFFGLILLFNVLLFLICLIPSSKIEEKVKESAEILYEQGPYYLVVKSVNIYNDSYTDSVIINECYSVDNETPYESYMKARKNYKKGQTLTELEETTGEGVTANYFKDIEQEDVSSSHYNSIGELYDFMEGNITSSLNYGRYWHGYLVFYRPLLLLANISDIRTLNYILFCVLFLTLIILLYKRFDLNIAILFFLVIICNGYLSASFSLESTPIFLVSIIASIIILALINKIKDFYWFIFIIGCIASYVDYLTVPLVSLGVPLSIYLLYTFKNRDWKENLKLVVISSICWFGGYAGTWIFKWAQYDLTISGKSMLDIGFTQSFYRMTRHNETASTYNIISQIVYCINNATVFTLVIAVIMGILGKMSNLIKKENSEIFNRNSFAFLLIALMPIAWYIALANHTILHSYFVYRHALLLSLGLLLAFYVGIFEISKKGEKIAKKK